MKKGKLFLIPSPLGDCPLQDILPQRVTSVIEQLDCFVVEEVKTARRFLSQAGLRGHIDGLEFHELNEHTTTAQVEEMVSLFDNERDVGLISEAGLPAVADPGAALVALCQRNGIVVVPLVGPSSLMLALMASGLNGQNFSFRGYLPVKTPERRKALTEMEKLSSRLGQTMIFIETPYRNDSLLHDILEICNADTLLCLATNITAKDEKIETKTIFQWRKQTPAIGKRPTVFILSA